MRFSSENSLVDDPRRQNCSNDRSLDDRLVLLFSGGLDSTALLRELLHLGKTVYPLYLCCGLQWETAELNAAQRVWRYFHHEFPQQLMLLEVEESEDEELMDHWSVSGDRVPGWHADDREVALPRRNQTLLAAAAAWSDSRAVRQIALGTLANNPFADATREFFDQFEEAYAQRWGRKIEIVTPLARRSKREIALTDNVPWSLCFSCLAPLANGCPCNQCNKCRERTEALALSSPVASV